MNDKRFNGFNSNREIQIMRSSDILHDKVDIGVCPLSLERYHIFRLLITK